MFKLFWTILFLGAPESCSPVIDVAKFNLGKVNLEAMLVTSFSSYTGGGLIPLAEAPRDLLCSCLLAVFHKVLLQWQKSLFEALLKMKAMKSLATCILSL